ncbi:hypothetical protein [Methanobrevibacter sp.]|nr:hypothetical protein [uncultured Methanobrevibacter sp.]
MWFFKAHALTSLDNYDEALNSLYKSLNLNYENIGALSKMKYFTNFR